MTKQNKEQGQTMEKIWQLHILDPRVTPRKETLFSKVQRLIRKKFKTNSMYR